ncbi:MAG TPA: hypothetical protein VML55_11500 [Planctomycetaceae bacterium]|nr:hypothetical protein [Planctomycetaceae bacterium]
MRTSIELPDLRSDHNGGPNTGTDGLSPGSESDAGDRPPLLRFFDAFLNERNIKWILAVGMAILFGSSAMLVASDWESFPPLGKFATLLAYTAAIFAAGELSDRRLGLRRTGTFLKALTVLLVPVDFLALRWLPTVDFASGTAAGPLHVAAWLVAGGIGLAFSIVAARRIFGDFLRGRQPTFLAAYVALALAGAVPAGWALPWPLLHAVCLWGVFAAGTVKVNRHVFWLVEDRRWPRICGFAPIALLGAQFVTLFLLQAAPRLATEWLGLACALAAVPILLTADAVLRVFEQRTGGLVRPLPPSVVLPFFAGMALCAAGLWLAASGGSPPYALVPTAALTSLALGVAAARSRRSPLVWLMLASALVAYRFCPIYFQEAARFVVETGAAAVRESRLPLAFYGLTCLPFVAAVMAASRWLERRGDGVFVRPMRQFAVVLSAMLVAVSFSHVKAILPVGAAMTAVFVTQARMFGDVRLLWLAAAACVAAALGVTPFVELVPGWPMPGDAVFVCVGTAAALLLWPGRRLESPVGRRSTPSVGRADGVKPLRASSHFVALLLAPAWLAWAWVAAGAAIPWVSATLIAGLLLIHAFTRPRNGLGEAALAFSIAAGLMLANLLGATSTALVSAATLANAGLWIAAIGLRQLPQSRLSQAFARPALRVSAVSLIVLATYHAVALMLVAWGVPAAVTWACGLVAVAWCFDAARRLGDPGPAWAGCAGVLAVVSSGMALTLGPAAVMAWYPAAWAAVAVAGLAVSKALDGRSALEPSFAAAWRPLAAVPSLAAIAGPVAAAALGVLVLAAFGSLPVLGLEWRVAGGIGAAGLMLAARTRNVPLWKQLGLIAGNWQVLMLVVEQCLPDAVHIFAVTGVQFAAAALPLAAAAALSLIVTGRPVAGLSQATAGIVRDVPLLHRLCLRFAIVWSLLAVLIAGPRDFAPLEVLAIVATFAALAAEQLRAACAQRDEHRVWLAQALAAGGAGYLVLLGVISIGDGTTMFALLGTALVMSAAAALAARGQTTGVLAGPFRQTATFLPLASVAAGVVRHLTHADPEWVGFNSLALWLAAGFYFWLGLEQRRKRYVVTAAVVLNVALAMLWNELAWSDPQFYMVPLGVSLLGLVELLKAEIPRDLRNPLRYAGALVVLVSPTFHIVDGSWVHLVTLMIASVAITLAGLGLRVRVLAYLGTGFLAADLVAMVVRGSVDHPNLLWIAGLATGAAVIALAAYCENHRETLLARLRVMAARLETWE